MGRSFPPRMPAKKVPAKKSDAALAAPGKKTLPKIKVASIRMVPLASIKSASHNPRFIRRPNFVALANSLERYGLVQPLVWNERSGQLVGGHQRLKHLRKAGVKDVPVAVVDLLEEDERALNLVLNSPFVAGEFNVQEVNAILADLKLDTILAGLNLDMLGIARAPSDGDDEDEAGGWGDRDELPARTIPPGSIVQLGDHQLYCGDARNAPFQEGADAIITDPPYALDTNKLASGFERLRKAVGYRGTSFEKDGKSEGEIEQLVRDALGVIPRGSSTAVYCFCGSSTYQSIVAGVERHFPPSVLLVWDKGRPGLHGSHAYMPTYEFICFAHGPQWRKYSVETRQNILRYANRQPHEFGAEHPTRKPRALIEQLIEDSTGPGGVVYDPFAGSGTTLLACERLGRIARVSELDARYAALIVARWEKATGGEAVVL